MNVTGNIISDLRAAASDARIAAMPSRAAVCDRAADEIERLEAKVNHLQNCIKAQDALHGQPDASGSYSGTGSAY